MTNATSEDSWESTRIHWMNHEIPQYLNLFKSFSVLIEALPSACASQEWKAMAVAMAKERWKVGRVEHIPR